MIQTKKVVYASYIPFAHGLKVTLCVFVHLYLACDTPPESGVGFSLVTDISEALRA